MKTINSLFRKQNDDMFPDYSNLLKVTIGVFSTILVVCGMHIFHILL